MSGNNDGAVTLARHMGLFSLVVYGVGDMVGAGIYGTIGVAAGIMGNAVWLAFGVSMVAAMLTGLSYASLGSRYPRAGGAAYITGRAYGRPFLAYLVGLTVAASGLTSMATAANVFSQTLHAALPLIAVPIIIVVFILALATINLIGIKESMAANLVFTAVEVGGLLFVVLVGARFWGGVDYWTVPDGATLTPLLLMSGAVLTFFAFIGFEDMLNVAEEVRRPETTLPKAIIIALVITTVLYMAISLTAVSVVPAAQLGDSARGAPMAQITAVAAPWLPGWVYPALTLFAVANTALLNYVMGSRMLYGMARQGLVPRFLGAVHPRSRTPYLAIGVLGIIVLALAFTGDIAQLASATSLLLLACFVVVNVALLIVQRRAAEPRGAFEIPAVIPLLGATVCAGLIIARVTAPTADPRAPIIAGALIAAFALLYAALRPKATAGETGI